MIFELRVINVKRDIEPESCKSSVLHERRSKALLVLSDPKVRHGNQSAPLYCPPSCKPHQGQQGLHCSSRRTDTPSA